MIGGFHEHEGLMTIWGWMQRVLCSLLLWLFNKCMGELSAGVC